MKIYTCRGVVAGRKAMLNMISFYAREAACQYDQTGSWALADEARLFADEIYGALDAAGFYDNVKKD